MQIDCFCVWVAGIKHENIMMRVHMGIDFCSLAHCLLYLLHLTNIFIVVFGKLLVLRCGSSTLPDRSVFSWSSYANLALLHGICCILQQAVLHKEGIVVCKARERAESLERAVR